MALQYSTPGVYIEELDAFPHSIVAVPTAIPAFIGYTQFAVDENGKSLNGIPYPIESQSDYETYFGTGFKSLFSITATGDIDTSSAATAVQRYYLYDSIRLFYANGGGQCYIISAGTYNDPQNLPTPAPADLVKALTPADSSTTDKSIGTLYKVSDVTLIVIPDAAAMAPADQATVYQQVLKHCNDTQSRMGIFDTNLPTDTTFNAINTLINGDNNAIPGIRGSLGTNYLNYGAAYFPWINCNVIANGEVDYGSLNLTTDKFAQVFGDVTKPVIGTNITAIVKNYTTDTTVTALATSTTTLTNAQKALSTATGNLAAANKALTAAQNVNPPVAADVTAAQKGVATATAALVAPQTAFGAAQLDYNTKLAAAAPAQRIFQLAMVAASPQYKSLMGKITTALNELPPSGAIAGVYTAVDNNRGVWKAPANVSLNSVNSPSLDLDKNLTDNLNVDAISGKSINAIRSFPGIGTLVFGGRTLDGNSQDWRYINVRRTLIMMEQSIKLALRAYVFEPNDDTTWITVKSMVINFLTNMWKNGALAGAKPEDAFQVMCGLGVTMTAQDILDGYMRVSVLVAVVHPAEFIVLTFQQELQTS